MKMHMFKIPLQLQIEILKNVSSISYIGDRYKTRLLSSDCVLQFIRLVLLMPDVSSQKVKI